MTVTAPRIPPSTFRDHSAVRASMQEAFWRELQMILGRAVKEAALDANEFMCYVNGYSFTLVASGAAAAVCALPTLPAGTVTGMSVTIGVTAACSLAVGNAGIAGTNAVCTLMDEALRGN